MHQAGAKARGDVLMGSAASVIIDTWKAGKQPWGLLGLLC